MRLDVALGTKLAYRRALLAREMVRVAEVYVAAMEERVRVDKAASQVGRIPEFWVLRSEAELANARQMLANAQRDYEIALIALKAIMGVHPDSEITLTDELNRDAGRGARDGKERDEGRGTRDGLKVELLEQKNCWRKRWRKDLIEGSVAASGSAKSRRESSESLMHSGEFDGDGRLHEWDR